MLTLIDLAWLAAFCRVLLGHPLVLAWSQHLFPWLWPQSELAARRQNRAMVAQVEDKRPVAIYIEHPDLAPYIDSESSEEGDTDPPVSTNNAPCLPVLVPRNAGAGWQGCSQAGYASADTGSGSHVYLRGRKLPQEDSSTQAEHQWSGSVALLHEISEQLMVLTDLMMQSVLETEDNLMAHDSTEGGRAGTSDGTENPVELIEDTIEDDAEDRAGE